MNGEYLNVEETAEFLRSSVRTLANWRSTGTGPRFYRLGKRIFYRRSDLVAWMEAHCFRRISEYGRHKPALHAASLYS